MIAALYVATVLLWGFSWYAMAVQALYAPAFAAVCHRIGLAALILMLFLTLTGKLRRRGLGDHLIFLGQGVCLFGLNFVCYYVATYYLPSGVLPVFFATSTFWAALFSRVFYGTPLSPRVLAGAALGVGGLAVMTGGDGASFSHEHAEIGFAFALAGAPIFALGNMLAMRLQRRGVPQAEGVGWGMVYGALGLGATALVLGEPLAPPLVRDYWLALLYLSIFASVLAFTAYLALVTRLGAARAAYATVLFPVVALAVSAVAEDFHPTLATLAGFLATLLGAALALGRPAKARGKTEAPAAA